MASYPELKGKSVLVTGAGRGIGLAIASRFVTEGAQVLLTDISPGQADQVLTAAQREGTSAAFHTMDVTSSSQTEDAIAQAVALQGRFSSPTNCPLS